MESINYMLDNYYNLGYYKSQLDLFSEIKVFAENTSNYDEIERVSNMIRKSCQPKLANKFSSNDIMINNVVKDKFFYYHVACVVAGDMYALNLFIDIVDMITSSGFASRSAFNVILFIIMTILDILSGVKPITSFVKSLLYIKGYYNKK
ncbi:MAG: hypothetical protein IJ880_14510 [Bacilli bacterium]|nr:hypothetical protein [Bacilli bacterium]